MARLSIGDYIYDRLVEAGDKGLVIADLFKDMKGWKTYATYNSFARYFWLFKKLGFVVEAATPREPGPKPELEERRYFKLTRKGKRSPLHEWSNPMRTLWNRVYGEGAWEDYMVRRRAARGLIHTGRPRGRPRKTLPSASPE